MLFGCCLALRAGLSALLLETMHFIPETLVGLLLQRRHGLFMLAFPRGYLLDLGAQGCKLSAEFFVFLGCCLGMLARLGEFLVNLTDLVLKTLACLSLSGQACLVLFAEALALLLQGDDDLSCLVSLQPELGRLTAQALDVALQ